MICNKCAAPRKAEYPIRDSNFQICNHKLREENSSFYCTSDCSLGSMVSQKQYNTLKNASDSYLSHEDFGIQNIKNVMSEIFGSECTRDEAVSWTRYWNELNVYEERLRVTHNRGDVPTVCTSTEISSTQNVRPPQ